MPALISRVSSQANGFARTLSDSCAESWASSVNEVRLARYPANLILQFCLVRLWIYGTDAGTTALFSQTAYTLNGA